jgi:2-polyprenyl-6-methoxyphenol hydroxylase-like FAD-dependent oxidoreductase
MADILVMGGGLCGLASALLLARDGHAVTVLERDPDPPPTSVAAAWERWNRRGVAQFRLAHIYLARFTRLLETELPDAVAAIEAAGGWRHNFVHDTPPAVTDRAPRPGDERFECLTARRSTMEHVLAALASREPRVTIRRGATVAGLLTGSSATPGVPHVVGVRTADGETLRADLTVDAMGRRSPLPRLLEPLGGKAPHEETEDSGFAYYGRHYHRAGGTPAFVAPPLTPLGSISVLTLPADNDTWSVTLYAAAADAPTRRFREPEVFERVLRACPLHAHWLDGDPIGEMASMVSGADRLRRYVVDGAPVVTGVLSVGDAWACTNPSLGRGSSMGLLHCVRLRELVRAGIADPVALAVAWDADTGRYLEPWHDATLQTDRQRFREMTAAIQGVDPEPAPPIIAAFMRAVGRDAEAFRALMEIRQVLALPSEVFGRPGFADHVLEVGRDGEGPSPPGPDRRELLALLDSGD